MNDKSSLESTTFCCFWQKEDLKEGPLQSDMMGRKVEDWENTKERASTSEQDKQTLKDGASDTEVLELETQ